MSGSVLPDDALLEDPAGLEAADPQGWLRSCAGAGAEVRTAARAALEAGVAGLALDGRPRALVLLGVGTAGLATRLLAALALPACPVPVVCVREAALPGWVGPLDLVVAVSDSGHTEQVLLVTEEAARRGVRLVTLAPAGSPLHRLGQQARALHVPVESTGRRPRSGVWALVVPLLVLADVLGLVAESAAELAATADALDAVAADCAPQVLLGTNPAKDLALALAGSVPLVWGCSPLTGVVADRLCAQLAATAALPGSSATLPDAGLEAVGVLDGPWAGTGAEDIFRDPFDAPEGPRLRLVLVRDAREHPSVAAQAAAVVRVAEHRSVPVTLLGPEREDRPLTAVARSIALVDFAAGYLALCTGIDPAASSAADELATRIATERA